MHRVFRPDISDLILTDRLPVSSVQQYPSTIPLLIDHSFLPRSGQVHFQLVLRLVISVGKSQHPLNLVECLRAEIGEHAFDKLDVSHELDEDRSSKDTYLPVDPDLLRFMPVYTLDRRSLFHECCGGHDYQRQLQTEEASPLGAPASPSSAFSNNRQSPLTTSSLNTPKPAQKANALRICA